MRTVYPLGPALEVHLRDGAEVGYSPPAWPTLLRPAYL